MAIFNKNNILDYTGDTFQIIKESGVDTTLMLYSTGERLIDVDDYITSFMKPVTYLNYNSVLIGGLGLGIVPYWISQNTSCSTIDVLENNNEIITWASSSNHLSSTINIIEADALTYTPTQNYDLIIMDLWWGTENENITSDFEILKPKYIAYLNTNGSFYAPMRSSELYN